MNHMEVRREHKILQGPWRCKEREDTSEAQRLNHKSTPYFVYDVSKQRRDEPSGKLVIIVVISLLLTT